MSIRDKRHPAPPQITFRSVLIGALAIPLTSLWVAAMENVYGGRPTYLSIFFHTILILIALVALNALLRLIVPRYAFNRAELLIVYIMTSISSGIVGDQFMAVFLPGLANPFWYATAANAWATKLWPHLPMHLMVSDTHAVYDFYMGGSTLYDMSNLQAWLGPGLIWAAFIAVTQLMCLCVNIILRRQWTDYEKLNFPLTELPMQITARGPKSIWRNKLMWLGFGIAAGIDLVNELHVLWPAVPMIAVKLQWMHFPQRWAATLNHTATSFYPFVIGIAFLLPADLSFSCWFFFWIFIIEEMICAALGYPRYSPWAFRATAGALPAMVEQGVGGYLAVVGFALWSARGHLAAVWAAVSNKPGAVGGDGRSGVSEAEAKEYRLAFGGLAVGMVILVWFTASLGMPVVTAFFFFVLYLAINTAISKIRAEFGAPIHSFHYAGPDLIPLNIVGSNRMSGREIGVWTLFFGFTRGFPGVPMPHQLEGMKMAELVGANPQRLTAAAAVATVVGCFAAVWALLHLGYREGVESMLAASPMKALSREGWGRMDTWLTRPTGANWVGLGGIIFGVGFSYFLMQMRFHFAWWPFHPIGYALAPDWTMRVVWLPILIGWAGKALVMRYAGPKAYHAAVPFALGLILGEFVVGGFWTVLALITHQAQYSFWMF